LTLIVSFVAIAGLFLTLVGSFVSETLAYSLLGSNNFGCLHFTWVHKDAASLMPSPAAFSSPSASTTTATPAAATTTATACRCGREAQGIVLHLHKLILPESERFH
jgi:hypothetical protein